MLSSRLFLLLAWFIPTAKYIIICQAFTTISSLTRISQRQHGYVSEESSSTTQLYVSPERKPFITGNWKLNPQTKQEAVELAAAIAAAVTTNSPNADVGLFVPFPFIEIVQSVVGQKIVVGAEVSEFFGIGEGGETRRKSRDRV